jgi:transposase
VLFGGDGFSVRCGAQVVSSHRKPRECPCGQRLSGTARKVGYVEVCESCRRRHARGLPQLSKQQHDRPAAAPVAAVPRARPPSPFSASLPLPLPDVAHATRHTRAAAALASLESKVDQRDLSNIIVPAVSSSEPSSIPLPLPPPSIISLLTETSQSVAALHASREETSLLIAQEEIWTALRTAMLVRGDPATRPPKEYRSALASRYLHTRILVDQYTAHAVLLYAFQRNEVVIVRGFPGWVQPPYATVAEALKSHPSIDHRIYSYNKSGTVVHFVERSAPDASSQTTTALAWWKPINLLYDRPILDEISGRTIWSFYSRRAGSPLHTDSADRTTSQIVGRKLWVFVDAAEAKSHGIEQIDLDPMREDPAGVHSFTAWLECPSFQWTILQEGDTLLLPRTRLHGVHSIGDVDSVSCGIYCWLACTPPPTGIELSPSPEPPPHKKLKRVESSPITPLPVIQRALDTAPSSHLPLLARAAAIVLHDDGQPTGIAAAKAGMSTRTARRWNKRARESDSLEDVPRSGRPRLTTPLEDAAIERASELNHYASNKDIRHQLVLPVSEDTIGRRLDAAGLPSRIAAGKIHYTDEERQKRLAFCHGYKHWTPEQWESVIFGDEVTTEGEGRKRHQRVRRPAGHRFDPKYTIHKQIYAPSQHLFACFCSRGPGFCEMYEGKLDGKALRGLLDRTLIETAAAYYDLDHGEQWWFVHDNSKPFTSQEVQRWLHNHGVSILDFPPRSPDLNPIENIWPRVNKLIDQLHPTTKDAVADAFINSWPKLALDTFTNFAQSMPARIAAVIEANGNAIKY